MEIQGTLKQLQPVIERGEFKSRKVWVTTTDNPEYPQTIELEVSGKNLGIFDNVSIGANVTCSINLRGREWTDPQGVTKVFNTLQCWKVQASGSQAARPVPESQQGFAQDVELPDAGLLPF